MIPDPPNWLLWVMVVYVFVWPVLWHAPKATLWLINKLTP